jgi:hypothetical protein
MGDSNQERIGSVAGVSVYACENMYEDGNLAELQHDAPILSADELREIADEIDEYYAEPTFEDRINEIADEYGLEIEYIEEYDRFPADAKLSLPDDFDLRINLFSELEKFCQVVSFYDDHVNVEEVADE